MQERQINRLWEAHFVDRQVQSALRQLIATDHEPDAALVRLLNKRIANLTASDIRAGLRRLEVEITCPLTDELESPSKTISPTTQTKKRKAKEKSKAHVGVSLSDLLHADLLVAPVKLFRRYKGTQLEATLKPNGMVEFQGQEYATCSTAAEHARGSVIGGRPHTNGWTFWKFRTSDGRVALLDEPRQAYLKKHAGG